VVGPAANRVGVGEFLGHRGYFGTHLSVYELWSSGHFRFRTLIQFLYI